MERKYEFCLRVEELVAYCRKHSKVKATGKKIAEAVREICCRMADYGAVGVAGKKEIRISLSIPEHPARYFWLRTDLYCAVAAHMLGQTEIVDELCRMMAASIAWPQLNSAA